MPARKPVHKTDRLQKVGIPQRQGFGVKGSFSNSGSHHHPIETGRACRARRE